MTKFLTTILLSTLFCLSCDIDKQKKTGSTKRDTATVTAPVMPTATVDTSMATLAKESNTMATDAYVTFDKDSVTVLPFEMDISLSQKAKERIVNGPETIGINLALTGIPKDPTLLSNDGFFYLASVDKEISYGQIARFDNIKFSRKTFDQLTDKNFIVTVNVFSGRKSSPDNLLNCEFVADSISYFVNKRIVIKGKLNGDD